MDAKRIDAIYNDLQKFEIKIESHDVPTPAYIQEKLILCNELQRKTEKYFLETTRDLSSKEMLYRTEKLNIEVLKRQTLVNNDKIKKIPTGKEREAAVDELLEPQHQNLVKIENEVCNLKGLLSGIKTVQANLKATNADIKTLVRIMEQQINRLNIGHPDDPDVKELAKTFKEIDDLETEIDLEDVETSTETLESEKSDDEPYSGTRLEATPEDGGQDLLDIDGDVDVTVKESGDESDSGTRLEATPEDGGQDSENIEDDLASFLSDDVSQEIGASSDEDQTGSEVKDSVEDTVIPNEDSDIDISSIDIGVDEVSASVDDAPVNKANPPVSVSLKDIGLDIDMEDIIKDPVEDTLKTKVQEKADKPARESKKKSETSKQPKKEPEKVEEPDSKLSELKKDVSDVDLEDILLSLDD